ncbi:MAG: F0F1 ATP synthase subunit alpha, partial [Pseudomonadota bacterium]
ASDLDASTQRLLSRGARLTELLKQPQYQPMSNELQVCVLFAGVRGYLDKVAVGDVGRFEEGLVLELKDKGVGVLDAIRGSGQLDDDTETKLKTLVDGYASAFA